MSRHARTADPSRPRPARRIGPWVALMAAGLAAAGLISLTLTLTGPVAGTPVPAPADMAARTDVQAAESACQGFVKQRLKSPASAQVTITNVAHASDQPGAAYPVYAVAGTVDSHNGFGALVRNDFICVVTGSRTDWDLVQPVSFTGNG